MLVHRVELTLRPHQHKASGWDSLPEWLQEGATVQVWCPDLAWQGCGFDREELLLLLLLLLLLSTSCAYCLLLEQLRPQQAGRLAHAALCCPACRASSGCTTADGHSTVCRAP